jgi:glycosyltransferase involved in cell wall biosynthesis
VKILHLATSIEGGAGRAALRSHSALSRAGVDSTLMYLRGRRNQYEQNLIKYIPSKTQNLQSRALTLFQAKFVQNSKELITTFSLDMFHAHPEFLDGFDVVHLHSMYNFVGDKTLSLLATKDVGVVVTMHDMRLATGGCHYSRTCKGYETSCSACPLTRNTFHQSVSASKIRRRETLNTLRNLTVITPSTWLEAKVRELPDFRNAEIISVNNPIPDVYFIPRKLSTSRTYKIGFISAELSNPYKGLDRLIETLNMIAPDFHEKIEVIFMGKGEVSNLDSRIKFTARTSSKDQDVKDFYDELDLLCVPSSEDNSPSVISEAISAGVPVIGSRVGGITNLLELFEMHIVDLESPDSLSDAITMSIANNRKRINHSLAIEMFAYESYARKLKNIYLNK